MRLLACVRRAAAGSSSSWAGATTSVRPPGAACAGRRVNSGSSFVHPLLQDERRESFGAFIGNLTNERNTRTALATEIYSKVDRDLKHATDMNDRARADREQSIDEYLRDSEILSRHYESIARDGVVSLSAECKVLAGVVAELIATRKTSYDEIVRTMGSVLDGLQNNMKKISTFIRPEDDQEEKFVF